MPSHNQSWPAATSIIPRRPPAHRKILGNLLCQASRVVRIGQEEDTWIAENIANNVVPQKRTSRSVYQRHAEGGGPRGALQRDECSNNREGSLVKGCAKRGRVVTFYRFPRAQWKALRTPNAIERLHPVKNSVIFASP